MLSIGPPKGRLTYRVPSLVWILSLKTIELRLQLQYLFLFQDKPLNQAVEILVRF